VEKQAEEKKVVVEKSPTSDDNGPEKKTKAKSEASETNATQE